MRARENPFATHRLEALSFRLHGTSWAELLARFEALGRRAALVGPEGSGKTALLAELGGRLAERGLAVRALTLRRGERAQARAKEARLLTGLGPSDLLLVDGADQLGRMAWFRLRRRARRACGLLVTAHREGLLPTLYRCSTSAELLAELTTELLVAPPPRALPPSSELFALHRGNLRAALLDLYDRCASG